jgi:opacity protein-like surface antigen
MMIEKSVEMRSAVLVLSVAVVCIVLVPLGAFAQDAVPTKFYLGLGVGPVIPQSVAANLNGTLAGSGTLKFNAAGFVGLLIGYRLSDHFGVEGEGGWTLYDSYSLTGTFSGSGGPQSGAIPLNGDMHTWLGLVNAVYRPRRQGARLALLLGAGFGAAGLQWLVESRPDDATPLRLEGGSISFAADAMLGVDYALSKRFSLGGRYNFVRIVDDGPTVSGGGIVLHHSDPNLHLLQLVGTYRP